MREPRTNHYISGVLVDKRRLTNAKFLPRINFKFHTTIAFNHSSESTPYPRSASLFEISMEQPLHPRILTHHAEEPLANVFCGSSCPVCVPSSRPCATRSGYLFHQRSRRGLEPMDDTYGFPEVFKTEEGSATEVPQQKSNRKLRSIVSRYQARSLEPEHPVLAYACIKLITQELMTTNDIDKKSCACLTTLRD
uniref:(northern house mosquito) hypothetical protein n=1 Tax=Culex pipiens TaxID=7175 RepID=A0A8D8FAU9_CULPI